MFLNFIIQEENEETKILQYEGDYTVKDLEKIFLELIDNQNDWYKFQSQPYGFITRKKYVKSVLLKETR